jgi:hypothetical protein
VDNTYDEENLESRYDEIAAADEAEKCDYDDRFILKKLLSGKTREQIALELHHKSYRTIDMYMRRHGYIWDGNKQIYIIKSKNKIDVEDKMPTTKIQRIINLFNEGLDPINVAKKVGIKDHRAMAMYMKSKGYIWSSEKNNYILEKGMITGEENKPEESDLQEENEVNNSNPNSTDLINQFQRFSKLLPMLELIEKNSDKIADVLSINTQKTIPRYIIGGITITKSLCMSYPLSELVKEFSIEKNISQKEIFEVAIIEFLKKYGFENEVNSLFDKANK